MVLTMWTLVNLLIEMLLPQHLVPSNRQTGRHYQPFLFLWFGGRLLLSSLRPCFHLLACLVETRLARFLRLYFVPCSLLCKWWGLFNFHCIYFCFLFTDPLFVLWWLQNPAVLHPFQILCGRRSLIPIGLWHCDICHVQFLFHAARLVSASFRQLVWFQSLPCILSCLRGTLRFYYLIWHGGT